MKSKAGLSSCLLQVYIDEFSCENIHVQTGQKHHSESMSLQRQFLRVL
uniref:Uncharacterized protein n=1 Tax=Anguilla anguilla TaxID=7936 RepID=A0A0E9RQ16_ANGAN